MAPSSRDRLSVDLHGLKAALLDRAQTLGVSPSAWVRMTIAAALGQPTDSAAGELALQRRSEPGRVRLSLRMTREQAAATSAAARRAGLSAGTFVAELVADVPVVSGGGKRSDHIAALVTSCAELSTFSRNLGHLVSLLRQHEFRPAEEYRPMLSTLNADVRRHLDLVARALAELRGAAGSSSAGRGRRADSLEAQP